MSSYPFTSSKDQFNSGESQNNQQFVSADKREAIANYPSISAPTTPPNIKISCDYPTPPEDERSSPSIQFDLNNTDSSDYSKNLNNPDEPRTSSTGRAKRRSRTQYTKQQIDCLEAIFLKSHYPEVHVVDKLSDKLNLSIERISVWFQNRRAKFKKTKKILILRLLIISHQFLIMIKILIHSTHPLIITMVVPRLLKILILIF